MAHYASNPDLNLEQKLANFKRYHPVSIASDLDKYQE
jgi:hypothetical protein